MFEPYAGIKCGKDSKGDHRFGLAIAKYQEAFREFYEFVADGSFCWQCRCVCKGMRISLRRKAVRPQEAPSFCSRRPGHSHTWRGLRHYFGESDGC